MQKKMERIAKAHPSCDGSCEVHKGEVVPVIIKGHGWDGLKFNYCQEAIKEDERRGFIVVKEN